MRQTVKLFEVIDTLGKKIFQFEADSVKMSSLLKVYKSGLHGYLSEYGKGFYLNPEHEKTIISNTGLSLPLFLCSKNNKEGFVFCGNKELIPLEYENVVFAGGAFIQVQKNNKVGLIDFKGKTLFPFVYDKIKSRNFVLNEYLFVSTNNLWGLYNLKSSKELTPIHFKDINYFNFESNLFIVNRDNKYGLINKDGSTKLPCVYKELINNDYLIAFNKDGLFGFMTFEEKIVVKPIYQSVNVLGSGYTIVTVNDKKGLIDPKGKIVITCKNLELDPLNKNRFAFKNVFGWGMCDLKGNELITCIYNEKCFISDEFVYFKTKKGFDIFDKNGKFFKSSEVLEKHVTRSSRW